MPSAEDPRRIQSNREERMRKKLPYVPTPGTRGHTEEESRCAFRDLFSIRERPRDGGPAGGPYLEEDEVSLRVREKRDVKTALLTALDIDITANMTANQKRQHKPKKKEWIRLESVKTGEDADEKYITRVDRWTCTCKAQAMHSCHLCKHLVQSLPYPPAKFWMEVVRRRTLPLYRHLALVISGSQWIEPADGSITDGDDHAFRTRTDVLAGGGGWRELDFSTPSLLGKRVKPVIPEVDDSSSDDAAEVQRAFFPSFNGSTTTTKRRLMDIARTCSNERKNSNGPPQYSGLKSHTETGSRCRVWSSKTWDAMYESSSGVRDTTWARKKGDKEEQRRIKNAMGYQVSLWLINSPSGRITSVLSLLPDNRYILFALAPALVVVNIANAQCPTRKLGTFGGHKINLRQKPCRVDGSDASTFRDCGVSIKNPSSTVGKASRLYNLEGMCQIREGHAQYLEGNTLVHKGCKGNRDVYIGHH
ncbi:hypothetical protein DFH08DRAFT_1051627 [Mycena albidolilacea]|uniref:SWIM-type domain-containing protein n=1 Tax=Mycena albidolilacea TaxID=1033008 RepID=A0AAD6Z4J7_9AGAR|nr:hypothetical protein DFH08DRAFT_1051627 [Mycena albidolilacea]